MPLIRTNEQVLHHPEGVAWVITLVGVVHDGNTVGLSRVISACFGELHGHILITPTSQHSPL